MSKRMPWSSTEDELIKNLMAINESQEEKLTWEQICNQVNLHTNMSRQPKQCRDRWNNQLKPSIRKGDWQEDEIDLIFQLQGKQGKKWAEIAKSLPGRTDNQVKNFFYSSLRKGIRQINFYMKIMKIKHGKPFNQDQIIKKLFMACNERKLEELQIKTNDIFQRAKKIKFLLILLSRQEEKETNLTQQQIKLRQETLQNLKDFGKNCKRKKTKRIVFSDESQDQCLSKEKLTQSSKPLLKKKDLSETTLNSHQKKTSLSCLIYQQLDEIDKQFMKGLKSEFQQNSRFDEDPFKLKDFHFEKKATKNPLVEEESFNYGSLLKNTAEVLFNSDEIERSLKFDGCEMSLRLSKPIASIDYFKEALQFSASYDFFKLMKEA